MISASMTSYPHVEQREHVRRRIAQVPDDPVYSAVRISNELDVNEAHKARSVLENEARAIERAAELDVYPKVE